MLACILMSMGLAKHEQVAIFKENERIVNVVQIERVRSTEQSGRYHNNPEKKKEKSDKKKI